MHTLKKIIKLLFHRQTNRHIEQVKSIYEGSWDEALDEFYKFKLIPHSVKYSGRLGIQMALDDRRIPIKELADFIKRVDVGSVAELGSGPGIFLTASAYLNPQVNWTGIELTKAGVNVAKKFSENPPSEALKYLTGGDANLSNKPAISFMQGDMRNVNLPDNSFDLVYTKSAIEEIPHDYMDAFRTAYRLTKIYAFFIEAFTEYQNFYQRLHIRKKDLFRGSYRDVQKVGFKIIGLKPIPFEWSSAQEVMLICKKV